jgi:hypothetical protein
MGKNPIFTKIEEPQHEEDVTDIVIFKESARVFCAYDDGELCALSN